MLTLVYYFWVARFKTLDLTPRVSRGISVFQQAVLGFVGIHRLSLPTITTRFEQEIGLGATGNSFGLNCKAVVDLVRYY